MLQSVRRDGTNDVVLPTMPRKQEYVVQAYPVPKECSEASNTLQSAPAGNGNEPINPRKLVQMLDQVRCSEHASIARRLRPHTLKAEIRMLFDFFRSHF